MYFFKKQLKVLCIRFFKTTVEMGLNDPHTKNQHTKYRQVAVYSYFLLVGLFVFVGKRNSYWCIFNLHWSTVPWRKKTSLTWTHFFKSVVVRLMNIFHGVFKQYMLLGFAHQSLFKIIVKTNKQYCFNTQMWLKSMRFLTSVSHIVF